MHFSAANQHLCPLCGRAARIFDHEPGREPRRACSEECHKAINMWGDGLLTAALSDMERAAISETRRPLYDALIKIGCDKAFENCTAEQIDAVIAAVWDGCRASMARQSASGAVPF